MDQKKRIEAVRKLTQQVNGKELLFVFANRENVIELGNINTATAQMDRVISAHASFSKKSNKKIATIAGGDINNLKLVKATRTSENSFLLPDMLVGVVEGTTGEKFGVMAMQYKEGGKYRYGNEYYFNLSAQKDVEAAFQQVNTIFNEITDGAIVASIDFKDGTALSFIGENLYDSPQFEADAMVEGGGIAKKVLESAAKLPSKARDQLVDAMMSTNPLKAKASLRVKTVNETVIEDYPSMRTTTQKRVISERLGGKKKVKAGGLSREEEDKLISEHLKKEISEKGYSPISPKREEDAKQAVDSFMSQMKSPVYKVFTTPEESNAVHVTLGGDIAKQFETDSDLFNSLYDDLEARGFEVAPGKGKIELYDTYVETVASKKKVTALDFDANRSAEDIQKAIQILKDNGIDDEIIFILEEELSEEEVSSDMPVAASKKGKATTSRLDPSVIKRMVRSKGVKSEGFITEEQEVDLINFYKKNQQAWSSMFNYLEEIVETSKDLKTDSDLEDSTYFKSLLNNYEKAITEIEANISFDTINNNIDVLWNTFLEVSEIMYDYSQFNLTEPAFEGLKKRIPASKKVKADVITPIGKPDKKKGEAVSSTVKETGDLTNHTVNEEHGETPVEAKTFKKGARVYVANYGYGAVTRLREDGGVRIKFDQKTERVTINPLDVIKEKDHLEGKDIPVTKTSKSIESK